MTTKKRRKTSTAMQFLEKITGSKALSLREFLIAIRMADEISLKEFAATLGISSSHLCDIEKGRKAVSLGRALEFAEILGHSKDQFVRLAIMDLMHEAGINCEFTLEDVVRRA